MSDHRKRAGRPTTKGREGEKSTLSIRAATKLKADLDAAARTNGRSLSQEAEMRLEASFRDEARAQLFSDLYFGRELAALVEVIARALRDAGTHAAHQDAAAGGGPPNWLDNGTGFDAAIHAATKIMNQFRPEGGSMVRSDVARDFGEAIANGLLNSLASAAAEADLMEEWAAQVRPRLGILQRRLQGFDYDVAAQSAALPSASAAGVLIFDSDDPSLLPGQPIKKGNRR